MTYILALDQGTSSSKATIFDRNGLALGRGQVEYDNIFPSDGWVEQAPEVLWDTSLAAVREALRVTGLQGLDLTCIGIANQRETALVWDRQTGECVYNAIIWQDRRTADRCEELKTREISEIINSVTGLLIDPYFSATKVQWILENIPGVRERAESGDLCFGTVDTYLIWKLTKGASHVTDATNASRTLLYDIDSLMWSDQLLDFFGIPQSMLPTVHDSSALFGHVSPEFFGKEIPITGVAGDQQAALIGQACFLPGMTKITYGTGCFAMVNTGNNRLKSNHNLLTTIAYQLAGQPIYALEGSIFSAGVAVKWLRDNLGLIKTVEETEAIAQKTDDGVKGVVVVPAFTGLGAPYWAPDSRALIAGLTLDTTANDIVTATLQSIGFQTVDLIDAILADEAIVSELRVDGGMASNSWFCQFLSDILSLPVERPVDTETTILGAAMLAALGSGLISELDEISERWSSDTSYRPTMTIAKRDFMLGSWRSAVKRALL